MSRGTGGSPRVSGRVESPAPRPDTVTDFIGLCTITAVALGCLLYIPGWNAGLI